MQRTNIGLAYETKQTMWYHKGGSKTGHRG